MLLRESARMAESACHNEMLLDDDSDSLGLLDNNTNSLFQVIMYPMKFARQDGAAPMGSEERELLKLIKGK